MSYKTKKSYMLFARLIPFAALLCAILLILSSCGSTTPVMNTNDGKEYTEIESFVGYDLDAALDFLDELGVEYEIVPVPDEKANTVIDLKFEGFEKNDLLYVEKNTVIQIYANKIENNGKVIYLTFDDGPTRDNTFDILDILDEYEAKATFFVFGNRVSEYDDRISAIYERGHELGCHSFSHDLDKNSEDFVYQSVDKILSEIDKYESKMIAVLGEEKFEAMPKLFRFPGGSSSNGFISRDEAKEYVAAVRDKGYLVYDWTALTNDADPSERLDGESDIDYYFRILKPSLTKSKEKGLPLIVLMHDKGPTKENLRDILDYLVGEGYSFGLISDCQEYTFVN